MQSKIEIPIFDLRAEFPNDCIRRYISSALKSNIGEISPDAARRKF